MLFTLDCAVVRCCNLSVGLKCVFCNGQLSWQYNQITAKRLVLAAAETQSHVFDHVMKAVNLVY